MPFLCCCRQKKKYPTVIANNNAEIAKLKEQLNEKQKDINDGFEEKERIDRKFQDARQELETLRREKRQTESKLKEDITKKDKTIKKLKDDLQGREKTISELRARVEELELKMSTESPPSEVQPEEQQKKRPIIPSRHKTNDDVQAEKTPKSEEDRQFLLNAIQSNDILRRLSNVQIEQMIDYMVPVEYPKGDALIKEGDEGDRFYILQKGKCAVTIKQKHISTIIEGSGFGEIAILEGGKRTATVTAAEAVKAWFLLRGVFKRFTREAIQQRDNEVMRIMKSVEKIGVTGRYQLSRIAQAVNEEDFSCGQYIVRQGEVGRIFYIIKSGEVDVTQNSPNSSDDKAETWIRVLKSGDYFGEGALRESHNKRGANVIAKTAKVSCYTLDEESFNQLIGEAVQGWIDGDDMESSPIISHRPSIIDVTLQDFNFLAILGSGGFGRVELVQMKRGNKTFALKCMKKIHIIETKQEDHVYSEKRIMMRCQSPFIVRLFKTFKNKKYVYMLMEPCLGGELWKHLRDARKFPHSRTRFYTACVVEALSYLHKRRILYRDLKPENLLLDNRGYVKIVDFGFAKELDVGERTWTFCGTPQYVAPEIILNQGHDISVDYWALGILIYEFLTGNPPFDAVDQMKTYRKILRGIDAVEFPVSIEKKAQNLIRRLCKEHPTERLGNMKGGINDIKGHSWFSGFDWEGLRSGTLVPEYVPIVNGNDDVGNFDTFHRRLTQEHVPSETSGWDMDF